MPAALVPWVRDRSAKRPLCSVEPRTGERVRERVWGHRSGKQEGSATATAHAPPCKAAGTFRSVLRGGWAASRRPSEGAAG